MGPERLEFRVFHALALRLVGIDSKSSCPGRHIQQNAGDPLVGSRDANGALKRQSDILGLSVPHTRLALKKAHGSVGFLEIKGIFGGGDLIDNGSALGHNGRGVLDVRDGPRWSESP